MRTVRKDRGAFLETGTPPPPPPPPPPHGPSPRPKHRHRACCDGGRRRRRRRTSGAPRENVSCVHSYSERLWRQALISCQSRQAAGQRRGEGWGQRRPVGTTEVCCPWEREREPGARSRATSPTSVSPADGPEKRRRQMLKIIDLRREPLAKQPPIYTLVF